MKTNISRKLMLSVGTSLSIVIGGFAQTANKNYITTYSPQITITDEWSVRGQSKENVQKTITYYDGLGRTDQVVQVSGSPLGYDLVTPVGYDNFGREDTKYLPYALTAANNGAFVDNDLAGQSAFYTGKYGAADGSTAFAKTDFEASPLSRILRQGAPGLVWQPDAVAANDRSVKFAYGTNVASEVRRGKVVNDQLLDDGYYAASTLYKTTTWDENNDQTSGSTSHTEEFKDLQGKVVLKVATDGTTKHYTYYIYDDFDLLRYVIPPKNFETGISLDELCYQYNYDQRKRMIEKKLPGVDWTYMAYDKRDRLIATQDPVMRSSGRWLITKYDQLNRPVMTALVGLSLARSTIQSYLDNYPETSSYYETRITTGIGYTLGNSFNAYGALPESDLLTVTYYDTYGYPGAKAFDNSVRISDYYNSTTGNYYFDKTKGLVTGTKTKVLETSTFLTATNYYDDKYRVIQTLRDLYATDAIYSEVASTLYDFPGKVKQTKQAQTFGGVTTTVDKYYAYDHAGRLKTTEQQITGDANGKVTVTQNSYNEIGQLIDKKLHKAGAYDYLQSVDYTYNIRGWLTAINNPDNLTTLQPGDPNIDLFGEKLLYETFETGLGTSSLVQYNGNISAMAWTSTNKTKRGYGFTYDGLNRLLLGDFKGYNTAWVDSSKYEERSLAYDLNGNIKRLIRTDNVGVPSADYKYTYKGNQLNQINALTAYTYDLNGNTTLDGLRGVSIAYNILNLPKTVLKGSDIINYIYSAAGEKLAKKMKDNTYQYYAGNMVYKNDKSLNYLLFDEGLVTKTSSVYSYEYHLKDHLGNTRVTFQPNGSATTTTQVAEYYPFGSSYLPVNPAGSNKYLYNGKEKQDDVLSGSALDWYDYGARFYDPVGKLGWLSVDPLAEVSRRWSPYSYCYNNPVRFIDPDGMLVGKYYNESGQLIGDDGIDDKKNYVIKTTKTTNEMYGSVGYDEKGKSNPISKEEAVNTEEKIKAGSFTGDHMKNVVKLNSDQVLDKMISVVSKDNSNNRSDSPENNREHGGKVSNGIVTESLSGDVSSPGNPISINITAAPGDITFHDHPSGTKPVSSDYVIGYKQQPSMTDINNSMGRINYEFGMRNGMVYIFNRTGVIATIPLSTLKK